MQGSWAHRWQMLAATWLAFLLDCSMQDASVVAALLLSAAASTLGQPGAILAPSVTVDLTSNGSHQLADFLTAGRTNLSDNNMTIPVIMTAYPRHNSTAVRAINSTSRHLLQNVPQSNVQDTTYLANVDIQGANNQLQGPFSVRMDSGSGNFLVQLQSPGIPGFDPTGLTPENAARFSFSFGGGGTAINGFEYSSAFQFTGVPGTLTPNTNIFAVQAIVANQPSNTFGPFPMGLGFQAGTTDNGGVEQTPVLLSMFNEKVISRKAFTVVFTEMGIVQYNPVAGGQIGLGATVPASTKTLGVDVQCAPVLTPPQGFGAGGLEWVVALQHVAATQGTNVLGPNNVNACSATSGCIALIDTGTFDLILPAEVVASIIQLLGLPSNPALVGADITGRTLVQAQGYPEIDCGVRNSAGPTLDLQIQDRVYSLTPADYIYQYNQNANNEPLNPPVCAVVVEPVSAVNNSQGITVPFYVLGDPFLAKYPASFLGTGIVATPQPRGVPLGVGEADGRGGGPEEDICFFGTVPVRAVCATNITLPITDPNTCEADISTAAILDEVNLGNRVAAFRNAAGNIGPEHVQYNLSPPAGTSGYVFPGGQTSQITLTATTPISTDSCSAVVTVALQKPIAKCNPTLLLSATAGCAAHIGSADLLAGINNASTPGSGGPVNINIDLSPPADGIYRLLRGTYPITITVTNCAGSDTCSTLVTVADEEPLQASQIICGTPANGIVETPLLSLDKTNPVAIFDASYSKANGCPVAIQTDNLSCRNCLYGSNKEQQGKEDFCDTATTSRGVSILPEQVGRVAWTVTAVDQSENQATTNCAICADHGAQFFSTLGHCPRPFSANTTCDFGTL